MEDPKYLKAAEKEFEVFRSSQYSGMPALVLEKNGQAHLISHGYFDFEKVETKLKSFLV